MDIYQSKQRKKVSVCFCILSFAAEEEALLLDMQRQMSESGLEIRQCYVYGDQTACATEFFPFLPEHYSKPAGSRCICPAHEVLFLAAGMMQKERRRLVREGLDGEVYCQLAIMGEKTALKQQMNQGDAYWAVKKWAMELEGFDLKTL